MISHPDIEWLSRRWDLPDVAVPMVSELLREEARGSTAWALRDQPSSWGDAVSGRNAPLVLVPFAGRLFLQSRRFHRAERDVAARLHGMAPVGNAATVDDEALAALFPGADDSDAQMRAARLASIRELSLVTGGPGTGKTYTLARALALLVKGGVPAGDIRLAAPTGKAADRMRAAVTESLSGLPDRFAPERPLLERVASSSATIHSLLGYDPRTGRCRFDASRPLPCAALIVDECSMIDLLLWRALLEALRPGCRLVLLGDPNQLESVGQGNVFAELARAAADRSCFLHPCHAHLEEAHRFRDRPGILALARALERCDADAAVTALTNPGAGVEWIESAGGPLSIETFPSAVLAALEAVAFAPGPQEALEALDRICILTAQREYFVGAKATSAVIDTRFAAMGSLRNQPVIIDRNDPETGLRNGTPGVIHTDADGVRRAWFRGVDAELREYAIPRLPDFSPAWAITIHRSQGSEYDDVLVILPHEESPMATRELLYTAITRARRRVFVAGSLASVRRAASSPSSRTTLLGMHLRDG